jgi:signal transduction histidine kinase
MSELSAPSINTKQSSEDILVEKGNQLHLIALVIVASFSVIYGLVNLAKADYIQAKLNLLLFPHTLIAYFIYRKGYYAFSKILNLFMVTAEITILQFIIGQETFILAFFVPILMSTLIVFQGKQRMLGYLLASMVFIWFVFLNVSDIRWDIIPPMTREELKLEWVMNLSGAVLITCIEMIFVLLISKRIQDKLLKQSDELEGNNEMLNSTIQTRDKMISIMSHDVRSPLILIGSGIKMVEGNQQDETTRLVLSELNRRADLALNMLDNLLLWSKSQSDQIYYSPVKIEFAEVRKMLNNMKSLQYSKNIDFEIRIPAIGSFQGDKNMIEFILRNLISNANKFTPEGGRILVQLEQLDGKVNFKVKDTGVGMDAESIQKLLQGDSFTTLGTSKEKGHGIGLPVVQDFIRRHGGQLHIQSEPGKGSEFSFQLS